MGKVSIFLTVGSQLPFNRLVEYCERIESQFPKKYKVFYQTCDSQKKIDKVNYIDFLDASGFTQKVKESDIIVTHAGIGSIITSFLYSKYVVVVPREFQYGEHRNDHQLDTANELKHIRVARDFESFSHAIENYQLEGEESNVFNPDFYSKLENIIKENI